MFYSKITVFPKNRYIYRPFLLLKKDHKKTISFEQDTATIFYQEKPYFTGDKIKVIFYRDCELNPEFAIF